MNLYENVIINNCLEDFIDIYFAEFVIDPSKYFKSLERRLLSLYCNAYSYFQWNKKVIVLIQESLSSNEYSVIEFEGIAYIHLSYPNCIYTVCGDPFNLGYDQYYFEDQYNLVIKRRKRSTSYVELINGNLKESSVNDLELQCDFVLNKESYKNLILRQLI